ncbi:alpha/beta-hydrolase [Saccharata proteae CBS 121410]|uniref:Carboxypeptidase n=1 Tax=Saccharata proteae CBS 121410 TaxID=1314787 RepID=A0A9P4I3U0_9PEZI|nr:alpha/beta-hydrolase [Saccharata proteae CBS 121410]
MRQRPQKRSVNTTSPYYTEKTAKFAVDGSALPNVTVDFPESYAGLLPVDGPGESDKELFFWFVPTENEDAKDEIVIWLNGGPGCSSLDGFFHENGPVTWMPGTYLPVVNTYSWSNLSNVVWIDQPVGTGYSLGTPNVTSEVDVAAQFLGFWRHFMDTFDLKGRKVYVTGESYAGMYVPYIADAMIAQNDSSYFNVNGIMIYDPSIGLDAITEEVPTLAFTKYNAPSFPFNDSFVDYITNKSAACGYDDFLNEGLTFPPKGHFGPPPGTDANGDITDDCDIFDDVFTAIFAINPCFDIYQVGQLCPLLWDTEGFPYSDFYLPPGYKTPYFDLAAVKTALHVPTNLTWEICSSDSVFVGPDGDTSPPSGLNGGPLARVAEATNNVIVGHGTLDMVLILNGTLLTLQNLTWNGAQGFSSPPTNPFYVPYHDDPNQASMAGAGVFGGWVKERGLTFVSVELSGHMVPEFQPSAGYRHFEVLLGRVANLSVVSGFTTQEDYPQPGGDLGKGGPVKGQAILA